MKKLFCKKAKRTVALLLCLLLLVGGVQVFAEDTYVTYKKVKEGKQVYAEGYDYSKPVPRNGAVDLKYFDDAVFLGDSRTMNLTLYTPIRNTKAKQYCAVGLNINTIYEKQFVSIKGKSYTALDAMKKIKKKYSKVYLMFGVNELGFPDAAGFIAAYKKLVDSVKAINKDAIIYVQAILPVARSKDTTNDSFTNLRVKKFNTFIKEMCLEKKVFYIDAYSPFCGADGYLPQFATNDGIHLKNEVCGNWLKYLQTHTLAYKKEKKEKKEN